MSLIQEEQAEAILKNYPDLFKGIDKKFEKAADELQPIFESIKKQRETIQKLKEQKTEEKKLKMEEKELEKLESNREDKFRLHTPDFLFNAAEITFNIMAKEGAKTKTGLPEAKPLLQGASWRLPENWELHDKYIRENAAKASLLQLSKIKIATVSKKVQDMTSKQLMTDKQRQKNQALIDTYHTMGKRAYANTYGLLSDMIIEVYEGAPYLKRAIYAGFGYHYTDHERRSRLVYTSNTYRKRTEDILEAREPATVGAATVVLGIITAVATVVGVVLSAFYYVAMVFFTGIKTAPTLYPVIVFTRPEKCR